MSVDPQQTCAVAGIWRPLRLPGFRNLLIADVASDIGAFMQGVGAAWMMVSLHAGPFYVALTQTAGALPFFILALPARAIGDIVDRRKLILLTEIWMAGIAIVLAAVTATGKLSPALLLLLTFALSAGDAFESPAWRVALPEMVPHGDLASAAALNGIEFNFARAIGRALGGVVIALAGAEFMKAIRKYERIRRRDGAYQWGIFQDLEAPDRYVETLLVVSWAEHLR